MKNRIRVLRAEHRFSQAELGDRLGVSRQTINAIENGRHDPSLPLAFAIADIFDQPIEAIFLRDNDETNDEEGGVADSATHDNRAGF